jgi:hypothetical protein
MISFILQLPFLFLIPCYSAILSETPRSRSTSGLGVVEVIPTFSAIRYAASLCLFCFLVITRLQNQVYILQSQS